ncbi:MAG: hypothetical protein ACFB51_06400, partial [Anaerolineae bacterium]
SIARQAAAHPHMDPRTRGAYFINMYGWYLPFTAIAAYLAERRVPNLAPEHVALRYSTYTWHEDGASGEAKRLDVRFLSGQFACLPDDPAANHPDALVMPDKLALREWFRTTLEAHLAPIIEDVYAHTRLSRHAQWLLAADACALRFLLTGRMLGDEEHAKAEGIAFVKAEGSPMNNPKTGYISLQYRGHTESFRARGGCCRNNTVSETGDDYSSTCELRTPEERDERLLAYMQRTYEETTS